AWLDPQGRIHLFVVATGLGGWAASRIVHVRQPGADAAVPALRFEYVQTLPLAWWWNTSFLVRNAPLPLDDGGLLLPVHYELGIKYPVALRFDRDGRFLGAVRISARRHLLQPTLLVLDSRNWLALMRTQRAGGSIAVAATADSGRHWSDRADLDLPNPDAAVAALVPGPGQGLLAYNPQPQGRTRLALARSGDGRQWQPLGPLAEGGEGDEFSYPALAWADGDLWVSYTEQRRRIAWQRWRPTGGAP
ncbi:MAG: hypothetical protein FGM55_13235, partial [Rhodoferax sp.]|nr:hypothetical protein [Rhodoferax sp.]